MSKKKQEKIIGSVISLVALVIISIILYGKQGIIIGFENKVNVTSVNQIEYNFSLETIPEYTDKISIELNNNKPYFNESDYTTNEFEKYSELDELGRCGVAFANICKSIMPKENEKRGDISTVKPTGWVQKKVEGEFLYNRCHLIGYQLAGENANELNLMTGTNYFNVQGMLPFENKVAKYINSNKNNHVLYRVTPIFKEQNLLANGVEIEAYSVEDNGQGVCFNVFIYNVQPGVELDYKTGNIKQN